MRRVDMALYLAARGWLRLPRKPGRLLAWRSPRTGLSWSTQLAFAIETGPAPDKSGTLKKS